MGCCILRRSTRGYVLYPLSTFDVHSIQDSTFVGAQGQKGTYYVCHQSPFFVFTVFGSFAAYILNNIAFSCLDVLLLDFFFAYFFSTLTSAPIKQRLACASVIFQYRATGQDVAQEMERNLGTFPPFPVRHPVRSPCR